MWICERCEVYNGDEQCKCRICGAEKSKTSEEKPEQDSAAIAEQALSSEENAVTSTAVAEKTASHSGNIVQIESETTLRKTASDHLGQYDDLPDPYERILSNAIEDRKQNSLRIIKTVLLIAAFVGILAGAVLLLKSYANKNEIKRTNKIAVINESYNSLGDNLSMI